jgi:hypothetical protein
VVSTTNIEIILSNLKAENVQTLNFFLKDRPKNVNNKVLTKTAILHPIIIDFLCFLNKFIKDC